MSKKNRINNALEVATTFGSMEGSHHKAWVIDQVVRKLLGSKEAYEDFVCEYEDGVDGPATYEWDVGIPP